MPEYIERKAAIEAFHDKRNRGMFVEDVLERVPAADVTERPQWISVEDRLPEERDDGFSYDVLVLVEELDGDIVWKDVYSGYYLYDAVSEETGWWVKMTCDCIKVGEHKYGNTVFKTKEKVTHWMPLPEPPKEET